MGARAAAVLVAGAVALGGMAGMAALPIAAGAAPAVASTAVRDDFDGDGVPDIAIAKGSTRVLYLRYTTVFVDGSHTAYLHLPGDGSLGLALALEPGDYNGDGVDDLAVGDDASGPGGSVFVFLGSSRHGLRAKPSTTLLGPRPPKHGFDYWEFGRALAAGDVDGDGRDDLAVNQTAMYATPEPAGGEVLVFHGSATGLSATEPTRVVAGVPEPVALADVNGDGHLDLVAGNYEFYEPRVLVFAGTADGFAAQPTALYAGDEPFGQSWNNYLAPRAAGDVNADGYADVIAGNPRAADGGAIVVLLGGPGGLSEERSQVIYEAQVYGPAAGRTSPETDRFGGNVKIGHVTANVYGDVLVSAGKQKVDGVRTAGAVFLLHGSADGVTLEHRRRITMNTEGIPGVAHAGAHFGSALSIADFSGDGIADALVGAPGQRGSTRIASVERGSVIGLRGDPADPLARSFTRIVGGNAAAQLGVAVA